MIFFHSYGPLKILFIEFLCPDYSSTCSVWIKLQGLISIQNTCPCIFMSFCSHSYICIYFKSIWFFTMKYLNNGEK
jgi:hypothetical protein